jgi:hypothetical protein
MTAFHAKEEEERLCNFFKQQILRLEMQIDSSMEENLKIRKNF